MSDNVEIRKAYENANSQPKERRRTLYGEGSHRRSRRARGQTSYRRRLDEIDQDLSYFLSFGKIVPDYLKDSLSAQDSTSSGTPTHKMIEVSNVCYHTLNKVADIKIRWVHDMTAHLQFDSRTKELNIFQYPSACLILDSVGEKTLLHRSVPDDIAISHVGKLICTQPPQTLRRSIKARNSRYKRLLSRAPTHISRHLRPGQKVLANP